MKSETGIRNTLYNPVLIKLLKDKYFPYFFLSSGLVLKETRLTRITNGCLEQYQGFVKNNADKNVLPHRHIIRNCDVVNGQASNYLSQIKNLRKRKANDEPVDEASELNKYDSEENWSRRRETFVALGSVANKQKMGYQKLVDISELNDENKIPLKKNSTSKLIITIQGIPLYQSNLDSLLSKSKTKKAWLDDSAIEAYI